MYVCMSTWGEMKKKWLSDIKRWSYSEDSLMGHQRWCHVRKWMRRKKNFDSVIQPFTLVYGGTSERK